MNHTQQANQWLRRFRLDITSNSNRLYANGRQQVEVTITIEPREGQEITEQQLSTLQLVLIDDDGHVRDLEGDLQARHLRDSRFDYHASGATVPAALTQPSAGAMRRRFYVSSTLPGGSLSTIHAGIWRDEHTSFETNAAPFRSSVVIESVAPPSPHESRFQLAVQDKVSYKLDNGSYWNDEIEEEVAYFGFRDPNNRIVASHAQATPSAEPFYVRNNWDHALISFQLTNDYSQHCRVAAYAVDQPFSLQLPDSSQTLTERPHHMTLYRHFSRFYRRWFNDLNESTSLWTVLDRHGNAYTVEFLAGTGGNALSFRLSDRHS